MHNQFLPQTSVAAQKMPRSKPKPRASEAQPGIAIARKGPTEQPRVKPWGNGRAKSVNPEGVGQMLRHALRVGFGLHSHPLPGFQIAGVLSVCAVNCYRPV